MSLRALGRQFAFHVRNANKSWVPGTPAHPQGALFLPATSKWKPGPDVIEAGRRKAAGENNPSHSWDPPMLQHHFLPTHDRKTGRRLPPPPEEQRLPL